MLSRATHRHRLAPSLPSCWHPHLAQIVPATLRATSRNLPQEQDLQTDGPDPPHYPRTFFVGCCFDYFLDL
jgi:hypothetical protein